MTTASSRPSPARPIGAARTYRLLLGASFRAQLQYRGNLLLTMLGGVAYQGVGLAFVWVVVDKFGAIGGWSMADIAFLYALRLTSHGLWVVPMSQLRTLDQVIKDGEFDRYLVRPAGPLVQLLNRNLYLPTLGDLISGIVLLAVTSTQVDVDWSAGMVLFLVLAVIAGAGVEASMQLAAASLTFRMLSTWSLRLTVDITVNNFGGYPLKIFPGAVRFGLTFLLPLAFVAYLPAGVLLGRADELHVGEWLAYASPVVGPLLFGAAYLLWRSQIRHYTSSGS